MGSLDDGSCHDREVTELWRRMYARVLGYIVNLGATPECADEIVTDAFLAARVRWMSVRDYDRPEAFVYKVATILYRRRGPRERDWREQLVPLPDDGTANDRLELEVITRTDVQAAARQLPRRCREVVLLRYFGAFSLEETAAILDLREGTVKGYASDGRAMLAAVLSELVVFPNMGPELGK